MFLVAALLINSVLGTICMMPMAMAAGLPMQDNVTAMEEMMTPRASMSHSDCEHCSHQTAKKDPAQQSSSCAGHCLSQAMNIHPGNSVFESPQHMATLPARFFMPWNATENFAALPGINASPPSILTDMVVLRL